MTRTKIIDALIVATCLAIITAIWLKPECAHAAEWDTTDKALFAGLVTLQAVDALQTNEIKKHPDQFHETNRLYGDPPNMVTVVAAKTLLVGGVYYMVKDSPNRKLYLGVLDALSLSVVLHNYNVGVRISF